MERPEKEIEHIVRDLCCSDNPDIQKATLEKYYVPDAGFSHPMSKVIPGPNSRDAILGIYQWYRVMSPKIDITFRSVTYNVREKELFLDLEQEFHIRWSPFKPAPARLLVHLVLTESPKYPRRFLIALQEDFYQPEDLFALTAPPLVPLIKLFLQAGALVSNANAALFSLFGYWAVKNERAQANGSAENKQNVD